MKNFFKPTRVTWVIFCGVLSSFLFFTYVPISYDHLASFGLGFVIKIYFIFNLSIGLVFWDIATAVGFLLNGLDNYYLDIFISLLISLLLLYACASIVSLLWYQVFHRNGSRSIFNRGDL